MLRKATAMTVRQNLGELLNEVQYRHDSILITKADKPVAALIDIDLFDRITQMKAIFEQLTSQLNKAYRDVPEELVEKEIQEALHAVRKNKKEKK